MTLRRVVYALACVLAPAAWGGFMYLVFGFWRRRARPTDARTDPPRDYTI